MKLLIILGLAVLALTVQCQAYDYELFSAKKGKTLTSDPGQPQIRSMFTQSLGGHFRHKKFWDVGIGGEVPLLMASKGTEERASVNVRGDFRSRFVIGLRSSDMLNADYTGGLDLVLRKPFSRPGDLEVFLYHKSSHLGDEAITDAAAYQYSRINYSREVVRVLYHRTLARSINQAYGAHYILRKDPETPRGSLILQYNITAPLGGRFFASSDLQCSEEHSWNTDVNLQVGLKLGKEEKQVFLQKLVLEYYTGYSRQGQFYDKREQYISLGIIAHI